MEYCLGCNQKNNYPICKKCSKKPFTVEKCRQALADIGDLGRLVELYKPLIAEINNLNTSLFWNKRLKESSPLKNQDGMTKDRIKIAFSYLPKKAKRILDIGIGNGFIEELLSKNKNIQIFGNDISDLAIKNAKNKFSGNFRMESIYNMKYPKNFFDAIFVLEVLEHIPPSKIFPVLKRIKNVLKKIGTVILSVPTNEGLEQMSSNPNGHVRDYTKSLIKAELKLAGFTILESKNLYAFSNFYYLKKMLSNILKCRWHPNNIVIKAKVT